jgi:hypothetical protein
MYTNRLNLKQQQAQRLLLKQTGGFGSIKSKQKNFQKKTKKSFGLLKKVFLPLKCSNEQTIFDILTYLDRPRIKPRFEDS